MYNLVSANFAKLKKDKFFWFAFFLMLSWSMIQLLAPLIESAQTPTLELPALDALFVEYYPLIGGLCAILTGLFIGREYSDGTIRNKVIAGHSRVAIYLANFVVSTAAGWLLNIAWIIPMLFIGIPCFGMFSNPLTIGIYTLVSFLMIAALTAIFTVFAMLISNKTNSNISIICAFLFMLMLASACYNQLCEPEMIQGGDIVVAEDGNVSIETLEPQNNPAYVSGNTRKILTFTRDFLPTGQAIQMSNEEKIDPQIMLLYSSVIIVLSTGIGIMVFRKKDLK